MKNKTKDSAFKGAEIRINELKMTWKMLSFVGIACIALQILIFTSAVYYLCDHEKIMFLVKYEYAKFVRMLMLDPLLNVQIDGQTFPTLASNLVRSSAGVMILQAMIVKINFIATCSFGSWFLYPFLIGYFRNIATRSTQVEHIRGPQLLEASVLKKQLKKEKMTCRLPLGEILIPISYEPEHIFIVGKTRVGKTVAIMQQIALLRKQNVKAVIYDLKGEYTAKFFDPKKDFLMNPLDTRCSGWTITNEIKTKMDLISVAQSLIPPGGGDEKFWNTAAQNVKVGLESAGIMSGKKTNADFWRAVTGTVKEIADTIKNVDGGQAGYTYIQDAGSKQALSVIAVLMGYCSFYEYAAHADGDFSIDRWLRQEEGSFIFLTGREEIQDTLKPMLSLFIDLLGKKLLSMPEEETRRIFFMLDEFGSLQRLPTIKRLLTVGGSKNATVEIGIQDISQLQKLYGNEDATTIFNSCGNNLVLNIADPDTADFFSRRFGRYQYWDTNETQSMGVADNRDGITLSRQKFLEDLILPSEIQMLKKRQGFVKIPEHNPCRVHIPITSANNLPNINKDFIMKPGFNLEEIKLKQEKIRADFLEAAEYLANVEKQKLEAAGSDTGNTDTTGIVKKDVENELVLVQPDMVNEMLLND